MPARLITIAVLLCCMSTVPGWAQEPANTARDIRIWGEGGPAVTTLGAGLAGGAAVEFDRHVLSLRTVSTDLTFGQETWDVALLYGRAMHWRGITLTGGTGVAVVGGTGYKRLFGGGEATSFEPMVGFPLDARVAWTPASFASIGLYGFANVNTAHPFGGIGLQLRLGQLR